MTTQPQWALLESFPASIKPDTESHAQPRGMTAGTLHVEQPLTSPDDTLDPYLKLTFSLPDEDDLLLARDGVRQLHDITSISANSSTDLRCQLFTTTTDGEQRQVNCVVFPMPAADAPPEAFILTFEQPTGSDVIISFSVEEFNQFVSILDSIETE